VVRRTEQLWPLPITTVCMTVVLIGTWGAIPARLSYVMGALIAFNAIVVIARFHQARTFRERP